MMVKTITITLEDATTIRRWFLPHNPNKLRRPRDIEGRQKVQAACRRFMAAMIEAAGDAPLKRGQEVERLVLLSDQTDLQLLAILANKSSPRGGQGGMPETVEELLADIATHFADGQRRPGSWERGMLEQMGYA